MALNEPFIKGTCENMCPEKEIKFREKEGLLHPFEIMRSSEKTVRLKADPARTVKKYARSAAGQSMPKPSDLRTPQALKKTVSYLLNDITTMESCDWCTVYDFVFDRLCAVRQDAVIQHLDVTHSIDIMKPVKYDPAINFHHFTECLRKLLNLYEQFDYENIPTESNYSCVCERAQFEALYLVTFLGNVDAISRGLMLKKELRSPVVNLALQLSIAYFGGNYIRVCRIIRNLPPLLQCSVALRLPNIRRNALLTMSSAFSGRNLQYPASALKTELLFEKENQVIDECLYYGIKVQEKNILFQKGVFKTETAVRPLNHQLFVDEALESCHLSDLLLQCSHHC
ncbi:Uncharacterized protein GBIM_15191 [Gryllus bimaculatus]|nr:Uncharacterized protein GBIM_15191 [Gryllus bimaculatus]